MPPTFHRPAYHAKNASIGGVSNVSNNSRFTMTRPKNPTECSSVSSKGSIDSKDKSITRGISIGGKLKTGKSFNQTSTVQCVSVKINQSDGQKDSLSPVKNSTKIVSGGAGYNPPSTGGSSKFSLVNRNALQNAQYSQSNLKAVLSPKSTSSTNANQVTSLS